VAFLVGDFFSAMVGYLVMNIAISGPLLSFIFSGRGSLLI